MKRIAFPLLAGLMALAACTNDTLQELAHWADSDNIVGCITVFCGSKPIRLIDHIRYKG